MWDHLCSWISDVWQSDKDIAVGLAWDGVVSMTRSSNYGHSKGDSVFLRRMRSVDAEDWGMHCLYIGLEIYLLSFDFNR